MSAARLTPMAVARAVLVMLALLAVACTGGDDDDARVAATYPPHPEFGDPADVDLPAPDDESETKAWLEGDGAAAVKLHEAVAPLVDGAPSECPGVAERLDDVAPPEEVLDAAGGIPDPVTGELFTGLHRAAIEALGTCRSDGFEAAQDDLAWQWALVDRRLDELEVTR